MDVLEILRAVGALLLVGGLLAFALVGVRRFGVPGIAKPEKRRRIKIVEAVILSPRQRLALVRRDDVEHLIVLGPEGATVIEKGIPAPPEPPPEPPATTRRGWRLSA